MSVANFTASAAYSDSALTTTFVFTVPSPTAVLPYITTSGNDIYNETVRPSAFVTYASLSNSASAYSIGPFDIPYPVVLSSTSTSSFAALAALGSVLGVVVIASAVGACLLLRRNRQLSRAAESAQEVVVSGQGELNYPPYGKEVISQEDSPEMLKRQLLQVRNELAAVNVLAPTTIRDQSDYVRDLTLLNDSIRQLSMRLSRSHPEKPAAAIRATICGALWSAVFAKFDAGLDVATEHQLSSVLLRFDKKSGCEDREHNQGAKRTVSFQVAVSCGKQ